MMKVGGIYKDVTLDYLVLIKVLEERNGDFRFEIIESDKGEMIGDKHILDKSYQKDFVLCNSKVRRLKWKQKDLQHMN